MLAAALGLLIFGVYGLCEALAEDLSTFRALARQRAGSERNQTWLTSR
jgi:hypothetical protein